MKTQLQLLLLDQRTNIEQTMKPITQTNMFLPLNSSCKIFWLYALCILAADLRANTILTGPTISGTLSPSGNNYVVVDNLTVPSGDTLTLEPGVIFEIGSGLTVTNNGFIQAVGTPSQRITIQAPSSSQYWNTILLSYPGNSTSGTNRFHYCDFVNAQTALYMYIYGQNYAFYNEVFNCTFSNCLSQCVYGVAYAGLGGNGVTLIPIIKNNLFISSSNGCVFYILGSHGGYPYAYSFYGSAYPEIVANVFEKLAGTALLLNEGAYAGSSPTIFINNTIVNCFGGVNATTPWDVTNEGNIYLGVTNAVTVSGSLSLQVAYNAFCENATNFIGYNTNIYGPAYFTNANGTPCDLLNNIYQNPLFATAGNFYLARNSPCVNAGPPSQALENICFPPSIGTNYGDMGAYGGPDACNWLNVVPLVQVEPSISDSNSLIWLNWYAVPRSTYQIQYATNLANGSNQWQNLANGQVEALGTPTSLSVAPYPPTNTMQFYRIQSLGRTPGN
jgi:hypothetical protein